MQCFGPECFCVDDRGAPIEGTVVSITQGRPNCTQPTKGTMEIVITKIFQILNNERLFCMISLCFSRSCFCLPIVFCLFVFFNHFYIADLKRSNCQIASATEVIQYRTFNHKCRWSGDFEEIQCDSASSQCWCVGKDGGEIPGTRSTGVFRCPVIGE